MEFSEEASCTISDRRSAVALGRRGPDPHPSSRPKTPAAGAPMSQWIWINGEIVPMSDARIGVEDRGFQFSDGVYEVIRLYNGRPFTLTPHLARLEQSCKGIQMPLPLPQEAITDAIGKIVERSGVREGMVYLQVTRGVSPRNHIYPAQPTSTALCYARELPPVPNPGEGEGVKLLSVADDRWKRCWIKSIALLADVLAKNQAVAAGADEAVFVENGVVTECSASNLFAVIGSKLVTHPVGSKVLPGITRAVLLECAAELGIEVDERPLREEEATRANELFITSTTREVSWVARWNDRYIGQARCGPMTLRLHRALQQRVRQETIPVN
jgi:D-alanine transaminase